MKPIIMFVLAPLVLLAAVAPALAQEEAAADLRIGTLPVLNALTFTHPWLLGYFQEEGFKAQLVPLNSAQELREAVDAGAVDGFLADLITTLVLMDGGHDLRLVRHVEITNQPLFTIVAHTDSGMTSGEELSGARIGLSESTVVQYVTDGMLESAGVSVDEVEYINIPNIVDRVDQLLAGEIQVATLPLPMSSKALLDGNIALIDDSAVFYVPEAYTFTAAVLDEKGDLVRAFLRGVERSVIELNAYPDFATGLAGLGSAYLASEQARIESEANPVGFRFFNYVMEGRVWAHFSLGRVPTEEEFSHARDWALGAGVIKDELAYEDVIDGSFLPEMVEEGMGDMSGGDEE